MFVKKFEAPTLEQALKMIKSEMGSEALILSTMEKKSGGIFSRKFIEVTAAAEKGGNKAKSAVTPASTHFDERELAKVFPHRNRESAVSDDFPETGLRKTKVERYMDVEPGVREEVHSKKNDPLRFESNFSFMGICPESAKELSKRLSYDYPKNDLANPSFFEKAKLKLLANGFKFMSAADFFSRSSWVPLGVAGAGKTTVIVKLALLAKSQEKTVRLVSLDSRKVVGRSELAGYARVIKVPFSTEIEDGVKSKLTLIDSPALSMTKEGNSDLEKLTVERSSFVVLDASARLSELLRQVDRARQYSPSGIVFTRLDMVSEKGILYDVLKRSQLPLIGISLSHSFKIPFKFLNANDFGTTLLKG